MRLIQVLISWKGLQRSPLGYVSLWGSDCSARNSARYYYKLYVFEIQRLLMSHI